jgi:quercetin dioxygenase-like cupin family protein
MIRRAATLFALTTTLVLGVTVTAAPASPPTGQVRFRDLARARVVNGGILPLRAGTSVRSASYSIPSGGSSGWHTLPGPAVLAVTAGTMRLSQGDGCSSRDYPAGQAVVAPAGTLLALSPANGPLRFASLFLGLAAADRDPLVEGPESRPRGCTAADAAPQPREVTETDVATGTLAAVYHAQGEHHGGAHNGEADDDAIDAKAGTDVVINAFEVEPGFSTGWYRHRPAIGIMQAGTLTYYEGRDGQCVKSDEYTAGQAWYHETHTHMAVNEGRDTAKITSIAFDVPTKDVTTPPVVGNVTDVYDFTPLPPPDCPRLR